jgi:hexosaminidase
MIKYILSAILFWIFIIDYSSAQSITKTICPVIPTPSAYQTILGKYDILDNEIQVDNTNLPSEIASYLQNQLESVFSIQTILREKEGTIHFRLLKNVPEHSYSIDIDDDISICYSSTESCFYAINSFLQLIEGEKNGYTIQKGIINDSPKFNWRGLHLDVSRHFYSVEEVKHFIDLMALYKFNKFHWHLTDDQGWRIEIKQFAKLTEIGAWRDSTLIGHYNDVPRVYEKRQTGGFYTQEQIKEVVEYASKRFISVIPEIEMPGHSRAALAAYPEYSCTGKQQPVPGLWGVFDDIFCSKPETIEFLKQILDEVIPLFPSEYVHIGGDEAPKTRWHECSKCQQTIQENKLKDEHELQSYFIRQMDSYLTSKGKKLIGWDEILEGGLSPNATVMSWRGEEGGIEAAKQKHYVIMSPSGYCYFDHYQSGRENEPLAIGGFLPLEKVYQFNPIPKGLTSEEEQYILGGQANLWSEYIQDMGKLEYMTYPRALALAQGLWCREQKPPFENFQTVLLNKQLPYLDRFNVHYSKALFYPKIDIVRTKKGVGLIISSTKKNEEFNVHVKYDESPYGWSGGNVTSNDTTFLDRFKYKSKFKITITSSDSTKTVFDFNSSSTLGFPIELVTKPNTKFNVRGDLALVDGIKGNRPWKGDQWLGFSEDTIAFILDLMTKRSIKNFKLGFLDAKGSWIYIPETVQISVSKDRKKWTVLKATKATEFFTQPVNKKGRYIRVQVLAKEKIPAGSDGEGTTPWTFMDELEIEFK